MGQLKGILEDKVKFSYVISFLVLGIFAFFLLVRNDLGNFHKLNALLRDSQWNKDQLAKLKEYTAYIEQFNGLFAERKGASWLMDVITKLAEKEDVKFTSVKPNEPVSAAGYTITSVGAQGQAPYADIVRFVNEIESYNKYLFVEMLQMTAEGTGNRSFYQRAASRAPRQLREGAEIRAASGDAQSVSFSIIVSSIGAST